AALIDGIDYYYMVSNDEAPIIDLITDVDACAQSGVSIAFTGSSGATQHDLWVDGSQMVVGITSPYTYVPGDTASHDYMVQAINGTCGIDSNTVAGIDVNGTTGTPVITAVNDLEACALTGVLVMFTAGTGAASHDLWVDGSQMVVGITSAYTYVPGDTASHDYVVRAINGTCETESNTIAGTDANDTPDAPAITAISDLDTCVSTGVQITFTAGSGATSHDLYVDGSLAQSGISSPYTHIPGDAVSHNYVVRAINGTCGAESNTIAGTDDDYASGTLYSTDSIVGNMRSVCAGTFTQGSGEFEACRVADETQFNHTLTRNLAVMETEVTRQMWADLLAVQTTLPVDPSEAAYSPTMSHPVNQSSWFETVLFANLLSLQNGLTRCYYKDSGFTDPVTSVNYTSGSFYCDFAANGYRLLSEGEWEYAARAGTTTPFSCNETNYTGDNCYSCTAGTHPVLEQYAVYCANDTSTSGPVGSKLSNPWNLKDMHGNVYEWCWDCYGTYPSDTTDYSGPISGSVRMLRGGIWGSVAQYCRSAFRTYNTPGSRGGSIGFRLARSVN
ncbi:formylglycine-generating enzyme family protein, partial [bacterium]|nr:formylglycine-generating enzyme family protein [bacterium]